MNTHFSLGAMGVCATLLSTTSAFADVTSQDVWGSWRSYLEGFGYEITADEAAVSGGLAITNLTMSMPLPEDGGTMTMTTGDLTFTDQGDGTVAITMPDSFPVNIHAVPTEGGDDVEATITYGQTGFSMIVSGNPDDMAYTYGADHAELALSRLVVDGETMENVVAEAMIDGLSGTMSWSTGKMQNIRQVLDADKVTYTVDVKDPKDGSLALSGEFAALQSLSVLSLPAGKNIDMQELDKALKAGFGMTGQFGWGAGAMQFAFDDKSTKTSGSSSSSGGSFTVGMDKSALNYGFDLRDYTVALTSTDIPLPINLSSSELAMNLALPISKSDTPEDFSLLIKLLGFAPDAMIWGIADPGGVLPHDPADLVVDLAGKANWHFDIMDPAQAEAMAGQDMPLDLHALSLKDLRLAVAGAELTGMGDFTFDMSDLQTFDGMPAPDGKVDLRLVGGNGLLDNLIKMGLVSEDDAMGMRMMMGLFGRPGEGEDELLSTVEVKPTGEISANGQRLQ